ncbi:MAG: LPS assembly protein LptD [Proteobacteria bacterium]|nr:LPS assembly protein LptD [Pseudomonadota bacterium]
MTTDLIHKPANQLKHAAESAKRPLLSGVFFLLLAIVILPLRSGAETELKDKSPETPWHINADKIDYNKNTHLYSAEGNVIITKENDQIVSDKIRLNSDTMETVATGNVVISSKGNKLTGSKVSMDLNAKTGTISDGTIFIEANHYYISGKKIEKTGPTTYEGDSVCITACDGDKPDWKISGKDLDVSIGGYGKVKHAILWLKEIPVFYTPFFIFPVKLKRQSGFLSPQFNFSKRKGLQYEQPFFWALNDSSDITVNGHYMEKRGFQTGIEYRYALSTRSKGSFLYDFMDDQKTDPDGTDKDWGYTDANDLVASRPNTERYWFRAKINQEMPENTFLKFDLDWVSDQDYLREFKDGYTGFSDTDAYFTENFGRSLDRYDDSIRINKIGVNKNWQTYSLNAGVLWYDDVLIRRSHTMNAGLPVDQDNYTLQKLPYVMFSGLKQKIDNTPFYYDLSSEYTYYFRKDTDTSDDIGKQIKQMNDLRLKGHQLDMYPRFYLPLRYRHYFLFEPSAGYRKTLWYIDDMPENMDYPYDVPHHLDRDYYDIKLSLSSEIYRIYPFEIFDISKIRHTVKPEIIWEYIPDNHFEKYPLFEKQVEKMNIITVSFIHLFTSKSYVKTQSEEEMSGSEPEFAYRQFLRFMIEQSYNLNDNTPQDWIDKSDEFSPLYLELKWMPYDIVSFSGDTRWSYTKNKLISKNIGSTFSTRRGDFFTLEYRQKEDDVTPLNSGESIAASISLILTEKLSVYSEYERNIAEGNYIKRRLGFVFSKQCWEIDISYIDEDEDQKLGVMVNLKGLGELETNFASP